MASDPIPTDLDLWRHGERLRALARRLIADPDLGEDVVQEAWLAALRRPPAARVDLGAWLAGAVRNLASRVRRREAGRREVEQRAARAEVQEGPEEAVTRAELLQRLGQAVLALDEPCRTAVILRHFEQLEPAEIARRQGCTREAARQRVARGLAELRRRLDAEHGGRERWCVLLAPLARVPGGGGLAPAMATTAGGLLMGSKWMVGAAGLVALMALWWMRSGGSRDHERAPAEVAASAAPLARPSSEDVPAKTNGERSAAMVATNAPTAPEPVATPLELLRGRVIQRDGTPVAGARVSLRRRELPGFLVLDLAIARQDEVWAERATDADGCFEFALDPGLTLDVWAEKAGFCEAVAAERHAGQTLELVLGPGFRVHGRVTRAQDGRPVAGALLQAVQDIGFDRKHRRETRTGEDGRYELRLPDDDAVRIDVLPLVEQSRGNLYVTFDARGEARLDIEVLEGLLVEGRVTDRDSGEPIAGAVIGEGWTFSRTAVTDANGDYRLPGFGRDGVYELHARAEGYGQSSGSPDIVDARRRRLDFALWPARASWGRLVDESGAPVSDAYVAAVGKDASELDWSSARSDADGRFRCENLGRTPRHALLIHHPAHATVVYDFPPEEALHPDLGEIVLRAPGLIAGRVRDASGRGIAGARVELRGTNRDRYALVAAPSPIPVEVAEPYVSRRETGTDEEGRFWFGQVAGGDYVLASSAPGRTPLADVPLVLDTAERRTDVELVYPVGVSLRGRVTDEDGIGLAGVQVHVGSSAGEGGKRVRASVRSAQDGTFEFRDLAEKRYWLEVLPFLPGAMPSADPLAPWLHSSLEVAALDGVPVELVVRRGTVLAGVLLDAAGQPLHGHQLAIRAADGSWGLGGSTDSEGRFTLGVEPAKTWTIEVSGPSETFDWGTLLVRAGIPSGTRDLELRLPR